MTAKLFVDFVLRHTLPSRARANGPEVTHDLIKNHPFVTEAPAEGAGELIETIRTRLIGVSPDDQDVVLEDDDWLMIVYALEAAK